MQQRKMKHKLSQDLSNRNKENIRKHIYSKSSNFTSTPFTHKVVPSLVGSKKLTKI